ncbi:MAG TPA: DUF1592 domain-containing protein [Polyangiaceae bacterium]|nr:DUF1592 domain-containing protein [Polyangiaceae bacterium]
MAQVRSFLVVALLAAGCTGTVDDPGAPAQGAAGAGMPGASGGASGAAPAAGGGAAGAAAGMPSGTSGGSSIGGSAGAAGATIVEAPQNPGSVVLRRLNRAEYNNTVADLLGTKLAPASGFPADDLGGDFDTIGSSLSLSPSYVTAYENAAHALVNDLYSDAVRRGRIVTCNIDTGGDACAQTVLSAFARKAWRRPVTADEVQSLMLPITTARMLGATATEGLKHALAASLLSPFFLFKVEADPTPTAGVARRLGPHELATRLSYALWSTMPDEALSAAADAGQLASDEQVAAQVDRMLSDARADRILDNFAAKWLEFSGIESHEVEASAFPKYTPALAQSMKAEARRFLQEFLRAPLPVSQLFNSRFTFVDAPLAAHYGLTRNGASSPTELVRVDTTGAPRQGLLTMGAWLTATSLPSRTSPVKRGEFVFSRLLCSVVPPAPPDVPTLPEEATDGLTMRQRMELHRAAPACSGCHQLMDPIGFGLENYDAIGSFRSMEEGKAIDASGALLDGTPFNGAVELGAALARDPRLPRCVTEKFMTFAIGRLLNQADDKQWVDYVSATAQKSDGTLRSIIRSVLLSDAFRSRQSAAN